MAECSRCHAIVVHECPTCTPELYAAVEAQRNPAPIPSVPVMPEPELVKPKPLAGHARRVTTRHGDTGGEG